MFLLPSARKSRRLTTTVAVAASLTAISSSDEALAQQHFSELRVDQLQRPSAGSPFTRAEGPHDKFDEGIAWGAQMAFDYGLKPLQVTFDDGTGEQQIAPVKHALLGHVGGSLSPLYWMNLELGFSFSMFESGTGFVGVVPGQQLPEGEAGQGDIRIGLHGRPITSDEMDVSVGTRIWAPTGRPEAYMAGPDRFVRWELVPAIAGEEDLFIYGVTLGLAPLFFAGRDGDRLAASGAVLFKVAPMISVGIEPHLAVFSYAPAVLDDRGTPIASDDISGQDDKVTPGLGKADFAFQFEPLASASFHIGDFSVGAAVGPGIGNAPGTPEVRAMLSVSYSDLGKRVVKERPPSDRDLDGIPDKTDDCPDEAGTKEQGGCPGERDLDGDGIIEGDACPNDPGASYEDPEANGCPDKDNDHFADPIDPCKDEPGPDSGGCPKYARLKGNTFVVEPPIKFAPGRSELTEKSRAAMIEVIQTMRANPDIAQVSVSVGTKRAAQRTTDARTKVLLELFNEQNLDSNRYEVLLNDQLPAGEVGIEVIRR